MRLGVAAAPRTLRNPKALDFAGAFAYLGRRDLAQARVSVTRTERAQGVACRPGSRRVDEIRSDGWPAETEALSERNVQRADLVTDQLVLDAFGDDDRVVDPGKRQRGLDRGTRAPARRVHGQATCQFDELGLGCLEQLGRGESLAEVVDRKADTSGAI